MGKGGNGFASEENRDGEGSSLPPKTVYFYSPAGEATKYPNSDSVYIRKLPTDGANSGTPLPLGQAVTVKGTWGDALYYVEMQAPKKTVRGFVGRNQLSDEAICDLTNYGIGGLLQPDRQTL